MSAVPTSDVSKQRAWERRHGPRAGVASLLGVIGLIAFFTIQSVMQRNAPSTSGLETLQRVTKPGDIGKLPSLQIPYFEYLDAHSALVVLTGVAGFVGYLGMAWGVGFLAVATRARRDALPRWAIYLPIVGGMLMAIGMLIFQVGNAALPGQFLDTQRTVQDAADAGGGLIAFAQLMATLGSFALAVGLFLVSLNAMRAGLLTRLFGYLGVAAGAFLILFPFPLVQFFWLAGLGALLLGVWPGGAPPAWEAGKEIPWPSNRPPAPKRAPKPAPAGGPAAAPRKRKKRR